MSFSLENLQQQLRQTRWGRILYLTLLAGNLVVLVLSLLSLFGRQRYFELTTHFRLQYALLSTACVLFFTAYRSWPLMLVALCCAAFNWGYILPYYTYKQPPPSAGASTHLKLMHSNVEARNTNYAALLDEVRKVNPDVIVLQEVTSRWSEHLQELNAAYPYSKALSKQGGGGIALFSRFPLEAAEVLILDESSMTHPAIAARLMVGDKTFSLVTLHPMTPVRDDKFAYRNEQFAKVASMLRATVGPKMLVGDLNTSMWSPYFQDLLRDSGLRDARAGAGILPSWPSYLPAFMRIPIDHCLVSTEVSVKSIDTGDYVGSDHYPLIVELEF